jgi:tRNA A-37 threonylcarbamoyl transferase component Bud32
MALASSVPLMTSQLSVGAYVGRWRIDAELGRGGMSTVYAVVHTEIGKRAALKVVHAHVLTPEFPAEAVLQEAKVVNQIAHSSIVDIFENGTLADGRPFLVMERLDGCSLDVAMNRQRLHTDEVIGILLQICEALIAAHAARIAHCDLKPENVFLLRGEPGSRRVKLLDWGIARVVAPRAEQLDRALGTPRYISPEQVQGYAPVPASDVYSLGVMAYRMFLEEQLFTAESTREILRQHLDVSPPPPEELWPGIPATLSDLLLAMLAKTPDERPTAVEVARVLSQVRGELRARGAAQVRSQLTGGAAVPALSAARVSGNHGAGVVTELSAPVLAIKRDPASAQHAVPRSARALSQSAPASETTAARAARPQSRRGNVGAVVGAMLLGLAVLAWAQHRGGAVAAQLPQPAAAPAVVALPSPFPAALPTRCASDGEPSGPLAAPRRTSARLVATRAASRVPVRPRSAAPALPARLPDLRATVRPALTNPDGTIEAY